MRQLLYISDSLIGDDVRALDELMTQARRNNTLDGLTGLLWTDGRRFAQVLEGGEASLAELIARVRADPRHANFEIVEDKQIEARQFGDWSMTRPANDNLAEMYQQRMLAHLARSTGALIAAVKQVIAGSQATVAG